MLPGFLRVPYDDIAAVRQLAEQRDDIVAVLLEPVQGEGGIRVAGADYCGTCARCATGMAGC